MPEPLLRTKLYAPPLRPNLVSRLRLIDQINQGLQLGRRLTLVSAPAGFGKTTLVSEWVASGRAFGKGPVARDVLVAWLSLDEEDNDSALFLAYLVSALQTVVPKFGEGTLEALKEWRLFNL